VFGANFRHSGGTAGRWTSEPLPYPLEFLVVQFTRGMSLFERLEQVRGQIGLGDIVKLFPHAVSFDPSNQHQDNQNAQSDVIVRRADADSAGWRRREQSGAMIGQLLDQDWRHTSFLDFPMTWLVEWLTTVMIESLADVRSRRNPVQLPLASTDILIRNLV
jgi:hypothetical protein